MRRLFATSVLLCVACGGESADTPAAREAAVPPLGTATITGTVSFQGTPPENPALDMREEPDCAAKYANGPRDPIVAVRDGRLKNVFVRVVGGLPDGPYPPLAETPSVDQDGCLYIPRVLGVMAGQSFEIRNSDPLLHNIRARPTVNRGFNISQPRAGMVATRTFSEPEDNISFDCNVHGWMHASVFVMPHPYFGASSEDGSFSIRGLPAGTYEIEAWHETLGTRRGTATVEDGGTATVEFTFGTTS